MAHVDPSVPGLSIVTTLYHSAPHLKDFYERMTAEVSGSGLTYELVLVNDGSPDNALAIALELQREDHSVVVVDLSRNFGHHKAIVEGLAQARGELVFLIDCDLEEPPEFLHIFLQKLTENRCDVVYGVQIHRKGGPAERFFGWAFYKLFNYLSDVDVPPNCTIARLMTRRYVDVVIGYREQSLFLGGVLATAGFDQVPVQVHKMHKGTSTYTLRRKLSQLSTAVTSFSSKPLRIVFYSGLAISLIAFSYAAWIILRKLLFGITVDGWTSLIVSIWSLGGLIILFLGVIGIYLGEVFLQTKGRPMAVVRHIYRPEISATAELEPRSRRPHARASG